jgi:outer membrane protein TolC
MTRLRALVFLLASLLVPLSGRAAEPVPRTLNLSQCLSLALEHNPQLRTASTVFLGAEGQATKLHAILYPSVNAQALSTPLIFYVQIQQIIYSRATRPQLRLSRLTRQEAFLNYRQALIDVAFQVRQAFTNALGAQEEAALDRQLITGRQSALKTARQLFAAGRLRRSDVLPLEVLASLGTQRSSLSEVAVQQGALALAQVIGVDLPANVQLQGRLDDDAGPARLDTGALSTEALRDRQDLKLLQNARLSAQQQIEIDLKNAWPTVGFESDSTFQPPGFLSGTNGAFDLERNYDEPETQRIAGDSQLPLSLYFTWQIFDGGQLAGVKASEQAQIASQEVAVEALRRAIPGEVAAAVSAVERERAALRLLAAQPAPDEVEKAVNADYEAGRVRLLDKTNLETDISAQRQLRLASQVRLNLALAALDHALGRGVEASGSASN